MDLQFYTRHDDLPKLGEFWLEYHCELIGDLYIVIDADDF